MLIAAARARVIDWPVAATGANARGTWSRRRGVILELTAADGSRGLGEATPLDARRIPAIAAELRAVGSDLAARGPRAPAELAAMVRDGAARFAIETAAGDLAARAAGMTLATWLRPDAVDRLAAAVVVDDADGAAAAWGVGARCLKIKIGRPDDRERVAAIVARVPGARLRLDANRAWSGADAVRELTALVPLAAVGQIELCEEPCRQPGELATLAWPVPIALDESVGELYARGELAAFLASNPIAAVVIKPTEVGGIAATFAIAAIARAAGVPVIISHALEGPVATAVCAELARALGRLDALPVGLAPHAAIAGWRLAVPQLGPCTVSAPPAPGLGFGFGELGLDELAACAPAVARLPPRDPLSIYAAASAVPDDIAVIADGRSWSFVAAATAAAASPPTTAVIARPELATVHAIHAALAAARPLGLIHHRATPAEQERQRAVLAAGLPADTALVLFTSGSTGEPTGIALSRAGIVAAADASAAHLGWRDDDRWLVALSLAHAGGLSIVVRCLVARKPLVLLTDDPDAARIAHLLVAGRVTIASLVPTQLAALLDDPTWRPPAHLRAVLLGGAAAPPAVLAAAAARGVPFLTTYGMTEAFGQVATAPTARAGQLDDSGAVGVPLPGVTILAGTAAAPAPIRIRAPQLAIGTLTGRAIAPELTTADLGWLDRDGALHVVGRADDVIITGGENVHPLTIDAVLGATPGVRAACAFGVADPRWGQIVSAALVIDPAFELAVATARWHAELPPHARPRRLALCHALPLLPSGKIDRRAAAALPAEPVSYGSVI